MTHTIRLNKEKPYVSILAAIAGGLGIIVMIYCLWVGIFDNAFYFFISIMYSTLYLSIALRLWKNPRIVITDDLIEVYGNFVQPSQKIEWDNISAISFAPYQIDFTLHGEQSEESIILNSGIPEKSIEVKEAVAEVAAEKGIPVEGG